MLLANCVLAILNVENLAEGHGMLLANCVLAIQKGENLAKGRGMLLWQCLMYLSICQLDTNHSFPIMENWDL